MLLSRYGHPDLLSIGRLHVQWYDLCFNLRGAGFWQNHIPTAFTLHSLTQQMMMIDEDEDDECDDDSGGSGVDDDDD